MIYFLPTYIGTLKWYENLLPMDAKFLIIRGKDKTRDEMTDYLDSKGDVFHEYYVVDDGWFKRSIPFLGPIWRRERYLRELKCAFTIHRSPSDALLLIKDKEPFNEAIKMANYLGIKTVWVQWAHTFPHTSTHPPTKKYVWYPKILKKLYALCDILFRGYAYYRTPETPQIKKFIKDIGNVEAQKAHDTGWKPEKIVTILPPRWWTPESSLLLSTMRTIKEILPEYKVVVQYHPSTKIQNPFSTIELLSKSALCISYPSTTANYIVLGLKMPAIFADFEWSAGKEEFGLKEITDYRNLTDALKRFRDGTLDTYEKEIKVHAIDEIKKLLQ